MPCIWHTVRYYDGEKKKEHGNLIECIWFFHIIISRFGFIRVDLNDVEAKQKRVIGSFTSAKGLTSIQRGMLAAVNV